MENHIYPEEHRENTQERILKLAEVRCKKCKGLLFKGECVSIEIKCRKCKYINKF